MQFNENKYKQVVAAATEELGLYNRRIKAAKESRDKIADYANKVERMGVKITRFAKDIGVKYSTLKMWCGSRKSVAQIEDVVSKSNMEGVSAGVIDRVAKKVGNKTPKREIRRLVEKEKSRSTEDIALDGYIAQLKRIKFNICDLYVLPALDPNNLEIILSLCSQIVEKLEVYKRTTLLRQNNEAPLSH